MIRMALLGRVLPICCLALALVASGPGSVAASPPGKADADSARATLEREGHVTYVRYDAAKAPRSAGETRFAMALSYTYTYRSEWHERNGRRRVSIMPRMHAEISLRHTIELPRVPVDTLAPFRRLLAHELDHVAISLDPRPGLLLEYLTSNLGTLTREVPVGTPVTDELAGRIVDEEVGRLREAVTAIIRANYARLDSLTRHGTQPLEDRRAFFADLYTRANLEALDFSWLARAAPLLDRPEYREARRYALP